MTPFAEILLLADREITAAINDVRTNPDGTVTVRDGAKEYTGRPV